MVPIGVLVMGAVATVAAGFWAWRYQRGVLDQLNRATHGVTAAWTDGHGQRDEAVAMATPGSGASGSANQPHRVVGAPGRISLPVLSWARFRVVSVVTLDGTAIVACRSGDRPSAPATARRRFLGRRWSCRQRQGEGEWPLLLADDETLVLLMGDGAEAAQAHGLLERWRRTGTVLRFQATPLGGGIEICDGRRFALRTALLAD